MKLSELIKNSGDSKLIDLKFSKRLLYIHVELDQLDQEVLFDIQTNIMEFNLEEGEYPALRTCHIDLIDLRHELETENGIYVPNKSFGKMMVEKRKNLNLVYGLRSQDYKYIFSLIGSTRLLSCVVSDLDKVRYQFIV